MVKRNKFFSKGLLVGLIIIVFLIFFWFLSTEAFRDLDERLRIRAANTVDIIDQRIDRLFFEINSFPRFIGNDLLFLTKLSSLMNVIDSIENETAADKIKSLENDFLGFLKESTANYQLVYIDENGNEIVKAEFDGNNYKAVSQDKLQNKKEEDYFYRTVSLSEGEVYITRLGLNVKNGEIENRGTSENPEYVPVMGAAMPVFDEMSVLKGVVFQNIYANYFLDDIRKFQRQGETTFLINEEGYYIAHPDLEKEFAFMFGRNDTFYDDYPTIPEAVLSDFTRRVEPGDLIFTFKYLYPTAWNYEIHKGSEKIFGEDPESNYFWTLISISEKSEIERGSKYLERDYITFLLITVSIILIIIILVLITAFKIPDSR